MKKKILKHPLISVIICTYNTKALTLECLKRLKKSIDYLSAPVEVIVVENGSDGTGGTLKKKFPWVKLLEPKENTGFAKGNNLAIKASDKHSSYYLLLNTDALIKKETLKKSVKFINKNPECCAMGCTLRYGNGKLQASAGYLPTPVSVVSWIWGIDLVPLLNRFLTPVHPKYPGFFGSTKKVGWVMGAYLFMKREVIEKTKGFDENFFMYMEEVDWCKRISDAGLSIYYTPDFSITHLDKASSIKYPDKFRKIFVNEIAGLIYFIRRYYPTHLIWILPVIKMGLHLRIFAFSVLNSAVRVKAYKEALESL